MKYTHLTAALTAAVFLVKAPLLFAQVEVVESSPTIRAAGQSQNPFAPKNNQQQQEQQNIQAEMYYQLQTLQREVANLRGQLEEQSYELKRLKQQRLEDYKDLDGRISSLSGNPSASNSRPVVATGEAPAGQTAAQRPTQSATRTANNPEEFANYNGAMDLIRSKKYDEAIASFSTLLEKFPDGQYAANSYHWLGQLYQLKNAPAKAKDAYSKIVSDFPNHSKASDAKLKLGQLHFQLGDKQASKALLEEVAASDAKESRLAKSFLQENFPQ